MALGDSWALLGGFGAAPGAPKQALGCSGGVLKKRVWPPGGSREPPVSEKRDFGPLVVFPEALLYVYSGFSDFEKKRDFFHFGPVGFPGESREGPERCIGRPESLLGGPRET